MSDVFRGQYRELSEAERKKLDDIKSTAQWLYAEFAATDNRETRLARTKLEEAVMWAVKGITG